MFSWIKFFVKIGMVLLVVQGVVYVRSYGWEKALRDAGWVGGIMWGWAEEAFEGVGTGEGRDVYSYGRGSRAGGNGKGWNVSGGRQQAQGRRKGGSWG